MGWFLRPRVQRADAPRAYLARSGPCCGCLFLEAGGGRCVYTRTSARNASRLRDNDWMRARVIRSVLVVDDSDAILRSATRVLGETRRVATATDAEEALDAARAECFDAAVVDVYLGRSGAAFGLVRELTQLQPDTLTVMISGLFCAQNTRAAFHAGARDCIEKPIAWQGLITELERGCPLARQTLELPTIDDVEENYYNSVVAAHGGNISAAARALRMRRTSLQRILSRRRLGATGGGRDRVS